MHRVVDAILPLLDLDLGGTADPDHRDAAGQLREPLLELLLVVIGGRLLDLRLDRRDAALDVLGRPGPSTIVVFSFSIRDALG